MKCTGAYDDGIGERPCRHTTADGCPDAPPCQACGQRHSLFMLGAVMPCNIDRELDRLDRTGEVK